VQNGWIYIFMNKRIWWKRNFTFIVHIPIFFGGIEWKVRFKKSNRQKKWLFLFCQFPYFYQSLFCNQSVGITIIGYIGHFIGFHLFFHALPVFPIGITKEGIPAGTPFPGIQQHFVPTARQLVFCAYWIGVTIQQSINIMTDFTDPNGIISVSPQVVDKCFRSIGFGLS